MRIFSVNYYRVLLALCALAGVGNVSVSAKTVTDIPTHLLGDWDMVGANRWGKSVGQRRARDDHSSKSPLCCYYRLPNF